MRERRPVYADENVERPLIEALWERGFDVDTSPEAASQGRSDEEQLSHAASLGRVMLTYDGFDYRRVHAQWQAKGRRHAGLILSRQGGPLARRVLRAAMLLDWLFEEGTAGETRLLTWAGLQMRMRQGDRVRGYTEEEVQRALGLKSD
jgi:hypothetical protein